MQRDSSIQKHIKANGLLRPNEKESMLVSKIKADQARLMKLAEEKVALAEKAVRLIDKHVQHLDKDFERLKDMGYTIGDEELLLAGNNSVTNGQSSQAELQQQQQQLLAQSNGASNMFAAAAMNGGQLIDINGSNNKKRKLLPSAINTAMPSPALQPGMSTPRTGMQPSPAQLSAALSAAQQGLPSPFGNSPTAQQIQAYMLAQQQQQAAQQLQASQPQNGRQQNFQLGVGAAVQKNAQTAAEYLEYLAQLNGGRLTPAMQQAAQQHFALNMQQQQFGDAASQMNGATNGLANSLTAGGQNANRPLRPSRLNSSFSASNVPQLQQGQLTPGGSPNIPLMQFANGMINGGGAPITGANNPNLKRSRPPLTASGSTASTKDGAARKKKRIIVSDDEGTAMDGNDDADGSADDRKQSRKGRPGSRAGTPMHGNKKGNKASGGQGRLQQTLLVSNASAFRRPGHDDGEGDEEDAEAEADDDWTHGNMDGEGEIDGEGEPLEADLDAAMAEGGDDATLYCLCQRVSFGNMIACDNENCKFEWFHWACVKITKQPDERIPWYCPECRPLMQGGGQQQNGTTAGGNSASIAGSKQQGSGKNMGVGKGNKAAGINTPYNQLAQFQQQTLLNAHQQASQTGRVRRDR